MICRAHLAIHSSLHSVILQITQLLGAFQSQTGDSYNPNHSGFQLSLPSLVQCKLNRLNKRAAADHPLKAGNAEDLWPAEACSTCIAFLSFNCEQLRAAVQWVSLCNVSIHFTV